MVKRVAISTTHSQENIDIAMGVIRTTVAKLEELSAGLTDEQLRTPLGEGERSFVECMAHLINCEERSADAITKALLLKEPLIPKIHPERNWGKLMKYDKRFDFAELLAYFRFRRKALLYILDSLSEKQWHRVIRQDGKQRKESIYNHVRVLALHEDDHVTDLENKLSRGTLK